MTKRMNFDTTLLAHKDDMWEITTNYAEFHFCYKSWRGQPSALSIKVENIDQGGRKYYVTCTGGFGTEEVPQALDAFERAKRFIQAHDLTPDVEA